MFKAEKLLKKTFILPLLILFTYAALLLDTLKYPGFVGNHFWIDAKMVLVLCLMALLFIKPAEKTLKAISKSNLIIMVVSGLGYVYFSIQEASHYSNYVLSRFHFSLGGLIYVFLFSAFILATVHYKKNLDLTSTKRDLWQGILYFFIAYALIVNLGITFKNALAGDVYVALHLNDTYDQKMHEQWGTYYDYMVFVKNNTPVDATIITPPQILPWVRTGNVALDRYFLYPRTLIHNPSEEITDPKLLTDGVYIMVVWGDWSCDAGACRIWPRQEIEAKEGVFMDTATGEVKEVKKDFIYDPEDTTNPFGLLRI